MICEFFQFAPQGVRTKLCQYKFKHVFSSKSNLDMTCAGIMKGSFFCLSNLQQICELGCSVEGKGSGMARMSDIEQISNLIYSRIFFLMNI